MAKIPVAIRIIDNKKILLTNDEYSSYEEICRAYDRPNFKGKDLFQDHFEVNEDGIIIFVKPPHKKYSSMEVFTFLISLMVNQQLRIAQDQISTMIIEARQKFVEQFAEIDSLKKELASYKEKVEQTNPELLKVNGN